MQVVEINVPEDERELFRVLDKVEENVREWKEAAIMERGVVKNCVLCCVV